MDKKNKQEEPFESRQLTRVKGFHLDQMVREDVDSGINEGLDPHHPTVAEAQDNLMLCIIQISDYMANGPQINAFAFNC